MALSREGYLSMMDRYQEHLDKAHRDYNDAFRRINYWMDAVERLKQEYGERDEQGSQELSG